MQLHLVGKLNDISQCRNGAIFSKTLRRDIARSDARFSLNVEEKKNWNPTLKHAISKQEKKADLHGFPA